MSDFVIVSVEQQPKGKQRLLLDNGETWVLYRSELRTLELNEGSVLSEEQYTHIRTDIIGKRAKKRALHLLERMERTEQQLRRKLLDGAYPSDLVDEAIAYVKSYHYIDDARYADTYVRLHGETKSAGKLRIELRGKGIDAELAERVLAENEQSRDEGAMIRALMEKRHYDPTQADQTQQRRMYAYLLRRGFNSADICKELKR